MNYYNILIKNTIEYIEENIGKPLLVYEIADHFDMSRYHFSRIFKMITGWPLNNYVNSRKLAIAVELLESKNMKIVDVAYELGFEYPEVFSRAFKRHFGISPNQFIKTKPKIEVVKKAVIIEKDIINIKGSPILNSQFEYFEEMTIEGFLIEIPSNHNESKELLDSSEQRFFDLLFSEPNSSNNKLYTVVSCFGEEKEGYSVFYGREKLSKSENKYIERKIPKGVYAKFTYKGNIFKVTDDFTDNFYRWITVQEIKLLNNGIGLIYLFKKDYEKTKLSNIYVPVKGNK